MVLIYDLQHSLRLSFSTSSFFQSGILSSCYLLFLLDNFKPLMQQNRAHTLQGLLHYLLLRSLFHLYCCNISLCCRKGLYFFPLEIRQMQAYFSYFTLLKSENPFHHHCSQRTIYLKVLLRC